jgi:hypothetical protein
MMENGFAGMPIQFMGADIRLIWLSTLQNWARSPTVWIL